MPIGMKSEKEPMPIDTSSNEAINGISPEKCWPDHSLISIHIAGRREIWISSRHNCRDSSIGFKCLTRLKWPGSWKCDSSHQNHKSCYSDRYPKALLSKSKWCNLLECLLVKGWWYSCAAAKAKWAFEMSFWKLILQDRQCLATPRFEFGSSRKMFKSLFAFASFRMSFGDCILIYMISNYGSI